MIFKEKHIKLKDNTFCTLRSPNEQDAEKMIDYLKLTSDETYFLTRYAEEINISVAEEKEHLTKSLKSKSNIMIAAFIDEDLAGNAEISIYKNHTKLKHRAVFGISIKKKYWNKGIGNALLKELIEQATEIGYSQIELGVFSDNKKAQHLYEKYGFKPWGTIKNAYKLKDGTYRDEIYMGLILK